MHVVIYRLPSSLLLLPPPIGADLLPDGPELIDRFIKAETDSGARRNSFLMLCSEAEALAIAFLSDHLEEVGGGGGGGSSSRRRRRKRSE